MARKLNVGIIQLGSKLGDVNYNVAKAVKLIKEAADKNANIVCLPELFATGYNMGVLGDRTIDISIQYYNFIFNQMSEAARQNNVYVIAPFAEIRDLPGIVYNSVFLFDDKGKKVGSFAKTHLWGLDKLYFKEGSDYPVFDTKYGKIGLMICYDIEFPEACRSLCLNGAEIVFVPAAWRVEEEDMWDLYAAPRALENLLFVVAVNQVGIQGDLHFFGKSRICNPRGKVITQLPKDEEQVVVTTIDLDDVNKYRTEISYLRDRKPSIYTKITEEK